MKLDGNAVLYQLRREFRDVTCDTPLRSLRVDYPVLYDESIDMSDHVVLVPDHERPRENERMRRVLCVCVGDASARAAEREGLCVAQVHDAIAFQHLYNRMQAVFVANERLDAQLRAYVDTYAGYQPLLDACARTMGFGCMLIDDQFHVVCQASASSGKSRLLEDAFTLEVLEEDAVDLFMASQHYKKMRGGRRVFAMPGTDNLFMKNVFWNDQPVGMLAMKHRGDPLSARYVRFVLNYLAPFVEDMYERVGTLDLATSRPAQIRAALKSSLAGAPEGFAMLSQLLEEGGSCLSGRYEIMHIERSFTHEGAEGLGYFAQRFERAWPQVHCAELDGGLYALADIDALVSRPGLGDVLRHDFLGELPAILRDNLAKAGMSRPFSDMRDIPAARVQADAALKQGSEVDPLYWIYRFDDYALSWLTKHGCGSVPAEYLGHPAVAQLLRYDAAHESELLSTLEAFMRSRYNATLAAKELFVARSTLVNRLERIVELTGIDLEDFDERVYLAITLLLI